MFHHFKIIILFLFVTFTLSLKSEKLTIILVTAPKKRPELTKTINDLNNALKNIPNELDVSDIIFIKGCVNGCQHPELDYAIDLIKQNHPQIKITIPNFSPTIQDGLFFEEWMLDSLSSVWKRTSKLATDWSSHRYRKHMIINFYFINAMKYVYENINFDYLLLSEDDQTYKNDFFYSIVELIKTDKKRRIFSKISWDQNGWFGYKGVERFTAKCTKNFVHGAYGVLRSKKELKMFLKWMKFSRIFESEDTLGYYLCESLDGVVEVKHVSLHFGWLKEIPK